MASRRAPQWRAADSPDRSRPARTDRRAAAAALPHRGTATP